MKLKKKKDTANNKLKLGFVVIGRNEGARLEESLRAIKKLCPQSPVTYVDSGSTDNSVALAKSLSIDVVELDLSIPFTAARARNAGFERLLTKNQELKCVQFLDGDCEMQPGWVEAALEALNGSNKVGIVSGRRIEKFIDASVYNALMDIEWNTPVGEARAVPGDMCVKVETFRKIQGFCEKIIAAEDDDLCIRARAAGYQVLRIDAAMSYHDANIMTLSQWYKRSKRGGHGYANINHLHGGAPEFYFRRHLRSVFIWGAIFPLAALTALLICPLLLLVFACIYGFFIAKTCLRRLLQGHSLHIALAYGFLIYTGKVPEFFGVMHYWKTRLLSEKHQLIEYK